MVLQSPPEPASSFLIRAVVVEVDVAVEKAVELVIVLSHDSFPCNVLHVAGYSAASGWLSKFTTNELDRPEVLACTAASWSTIATVTPMLPRKILISANAEVEQLNSIDRANMITSMRLVLFCSD